MIDEIEDLWKLAAECREWAQQPNPVQTDDWDRVIRGQFKRLADRLDEIASALAARMPT
jgi:hypothetical protein